MKKEKTIILAVGILLASALAHAESRPNDQALEQASDQAVFHRMSDWMATIGKSPEEKEAKRAERRAAREAKRASKAADKEAKKASKEMEREARKAKEGAKKNG